MQWMKSMERRILAMGGGILAGAMLAGCSSGFSSKDAARYDQQEFQSEGNFSRTFPVTQAQACEAVRRTLLGQGYVVPTARADSVNATKAFQPQGDTHLEITFHVVCAPERSVAGAPRATIFASALQDRFATRKTNTAASVGVSAIGSLSLPFFATDDSMVKVASQTIASKPFYDRFYGLVADDLAAIPDDQSTGHELDPENKPTGQADKPAPESGGAAQPPSTRPTTATSAGGGE